MTIHAYPHPAMAGAVLLHSTNARTSWYVGRDEFGDFANAIKRGDFDGLLRGEPVGDDVPPVHVPPSGHRDLGPDAVPVDEQIDVAKSDDPMRPPWQRRGGHHA